MRKLILNLMMVLSLAIPILAQPLPAQAACSGNSAKGQVLQGIGSTGGDCTDSGVNGVIHGIVNILSLVAGAIGVIMIILAGFKYITSGGDSNAVSNAKSTLVFALIGIAIAALAQVLVHFVLFQTNKAAGS